MGSDFSQALRAFRDGAWSTEQLLSEVDREVEEKRTDAVTLLAILYEENSKAELPPNVHGALERKILQWLHQYSVIRTHAPGGSRPESLSGADGAATVVFDIPGANEDNTDESSEAKSLSVGTAAEGDVLHGRFKLVERIGQGGMSSVFKAIDMRKVEARSPDPFVAVKLLTLPVSDFSRALVLLQREAQKLQSLTHANVVRVSDCDRDGKTVFMTMEYLSGESLQRKFQSPAFTGLPSSEAARIVECIAAGLAAAHRKDIVHGDLKPGNVIITDRGEVKVIDFGIARVMHGDDEAAEITALTPPYASPEMLERKDPDPRDDIYALACIANEVLTGRHPFDWKTATAARDAGLAPAKHSGVSRQQFKAISRALAFDRAERTPTVEQFLNDFRGAKAARRKRALALAGVTLIVLLFALYRFNEKSVAPPQSQTGASNVVAKISPGDVFRDCPTCPLMRAVPAGKFEQGASPDDPEAEAFEQPHHAVTIANPFGMGVDEVTVGEFREFVAATHREINGCEIYDGAWNVREDLSWKNPGYSQNVSYPVTCVSWDDAAAYAQWLSTKTSRHYRLPSASEWEYASRAGAGVTRPWGAQTESACDSANVADQTAAKDYPGWRVHACADNFTYAAPVGSFAANAFGMHDMLGNVFEWVQDCWQGDYQNAPKDGSAQQNGDCSQREMRGGSWFTTPAFVGSSRRNRFEVEHRSSSIGFRITRDLTNDQ